MTRPLLRFRLLHALALSAMAAMLTTTSRAQTTPVGKPAARTVAFAARPADAVALFDSVTAVATGMVPASIKALQTAGYRTAGDGGGALYARADAEPGHAGRIRSADGAWWVLAPGPTAVNARTLGAAGDGAADDTAAVADTLKVALALNRPAYFPAGTYRITASIDAGSSGADGAQANKIAGDGRDLTVIEEAADNIPILKLGGAFGYVHDLTLTYRRRQPSANASANAIEFYAYRWSSIERVKVVNAYRGEAIKQAPIYAGANWISNVCQRDLYFEAFSGSAMHLSSYRGGSGGVCLENIYTVSRDAQGAPQSVDAPFYFQSFSEIVGANLHVEGSRPNEGMVFGTVNNLVLNGSHFESLAPREDYGGLIHLMGSNAVISGTTVYGNSFLKEALPHQYALFRMDSASTLTADSLYETASTITTPHARQFSASGGGNAIFSRSVRVKGFTDVGSLSPASQLKARE